MSQFSLCIDVYIKPALHVAERWIWWRWVEIKCNRTLYEVVMKYKHNLLYRALVWLVIYKLNTHLSDNGGIFFFFSMNRKRWISACLLFLLVDERGEIFYCLGTYLKGFWWVVWIPAVNNGRFIIKRLESDFPLRTNVIWTVIFLFRLIGWFAVIISHFNSLEIFRWEVIFCINYA